MPGWVDAHATTQTAGAPAATSIASPSNRSRASQSQRPMPAAATTMPAREYVSTRAMAAT